MSQFNKISQVFEGALERANLRGWIYRKREGGSIIFLALRDSSGVIQAVAKKGCVGWEDAKKATIESSFEVEGKVRKDERAPGGFEVGIESFRLIGLAERFPISKDLGLKHILDNRHLWIRSRRMNAIFKIRSTALDAIHQYFRSNGFYETSAPSFVTAACEGGSTLFETNYFGKKAYLTQSAQFYLEALITSLEKVYTIAPSFRAEKSKTRRHLTEYLHAEAEAAWCGLDGIMKVEEELIMHVISNVLDKNKKELVIVKRDPKVLEGIKLPFERMDYDTAVDAINKTGGLSLAYDADIGADEERILTDELTSPIFLVRPPLKVKAFYHAPDPANDGRALAADLLAPEGYGEIIGGGQRIDSLDLLTSQIRNFGLDPKDYGWYLDLRRYGSVPHAGFGLGVERLVMWLCHMKHIRDAVPFPRTINRVYP